MRTCYLTILSICVVAFFAGCRQQTLPEYTAGPYDMNQPGQRGVDGPGPGVVPVNAHTGGGYGQGMAANPQMPQGPQTTQIAFVGPSGGTVRWDVSAPAMFDSEPLICPGRQNFTQGGIYRLKLTDIPGHPGMELYPTLEVAPGMPRTQAFLAHSMVPVNFTEEDIMQVMSGNFVTKVIYLPDPEFQELALAVGTPDTLVSTRLDPGVDPISEADRRGAILAIVRLGNKSVDAEEQQPMGGMMMEHNGMMMGVPGGAVTGNYISGVTGPEYGQPITATAHGYPGPVELPHGEPARRAGTFINR